MAFRHGNDTNNNTDSEDDTPNNKLWIFGYGSLLWNPGFKYTNMIVGYVQGYSRKFWQGNTVQRGTPGQPGRVVTLVEDTECLTWGTAYELDEKEAELTLSYLNNRESTLGGYITTITQFYTKDGSKKPFPVLLYIATADNSNYLGPAPLKELANQIVAACGTCGHNVEYVIRLADFMRERVPEVNDEHLYLLEEHVRMKIKERKLCLNSLMGPSYVGPSTLLIENREFSDRNLDDIVAQDGLAAGGIFAHNDDIQQPVLELERPREGRSTFLYASRVPPKKLRCLNV